MRRGRPPFKPSARRDAHQALIRVLAARLPAGTRLLSSRSTTWASVTFVGARHEFAYAFLADDCAEVARLPGEIGELEFALPGHFVAEIRAMCDGTALTIETLTIED